MYKPNNKKMLTVLISVFMVFSAFAVLSLAATPAYAASGTFTVNPTTYTTISGVATTPIKAYVSGGSFGSGSTVYFYLSKSTTANEILNTTSGSGGGTLTTNAIGHVSITGSSLANVLSFSFGSFTIPHGTYYILAEDYLSGSPSGTYAVGPKATFVEVTSAPTISVAESSTAATTGMTLTVTGDHWDAGASVTVYYTYPGNSSALTTATASSTGSISVKLTGVSLALDTYDIVAQETNTLSTTYTLGGVTSDKSFSITPHVAVSPASISGETSSTFTVYGFGFPASDTFAVSPSLNPTDTITVDGVNAINPSFSASASGTFSVGVTGLASAVTTGTQDISVTDSTSTLFSDIGTIIVSSTNPIHLGFTFTVTPTYGSTYNVNDSVAVDIFNFPASQSVSISMGSYSVGSVTTDVNGAGSLNTVVPALPAGTYVPTASVSAQGLIKTASSVSISADFQVLDPSGAAVTNTASEYVPANGTLTVTANGLTPTSQYDIFDSAIGNYGVYANNSAFVTVMVGGAGSVGLYPASNGTLIVSYTSEYAMPATPATSTVLLKSTSPSIASIAGYNANTYEYNEVVTPTLSLTSYTIEKSGATGISVTASNLVPDGSTLYPGLTDQYNLYLGNQVMTIEATHGAVLSYTTVFNSSYALTSFNASAVVGIYNLNLTYNGMAVSSALASVPLVISAYGAEVSSGTLMLIASGSGYYVVAYGLNNTVTSANMKLYYTTSAGVSSGTTETVSHGAFVDTSTLESGTFTTALASDPAGTYSVFIAFPSTPTTFIYTSYSVVTNITLSDSVTSVYSGYIGDTVTLGSTGLLANQFYAVYFNNIEVKTFSASGSGSVSGLTFMVPIVPDGNYYVNITALSSVPSGNSTAPPSATVVASAGFGVLASLSVTLSTDAPVAFPGQMVTFAWNPGTGHYPAAITTGGTNGPIEVSVYLNGTAYTTEPAALSSNGKYLNGSFLMPNGAIGSYFFVTLGWTQADYSGATPVVNAYTQTAGAYIQLVSGNGALLTGISSAQIASLTAAVGTQITTSMKIPLSELNASVVSIKGLTANITTAFGTMTSTLTAINATVAAIESGQVVVSTDLGSISTSLASLNSSLAAFNNNVVTINTTLGQVQTSLGSIGTTVTANAAGIAQVHTDVGTVQGQIVSQNGNVSTIHTALGDLNATVQKINTNTQGFGTLEVFLIVIVILVLITLVLSFMAVNAANKASRKASEQKKE